jgi:hypothetical protein
LLDQYEDQLNPRVFELAKENIEKETKQEKAKELPKTTTRKVQKKSAISDTENVKKTTAVKKVSPAKTEIQANAESGETETPRKKVVKRKTAED